MSEPHPDNIPTSARLAPRPRDGSSSAAELDATVLPRVLSVPPAPRWRSFGFGRSFTRGFRFQLETLLDRGHEFVPFQRLLDAVHGQGRPVEGTELILSFAGCGAVFLDDIWPVLEEYRIAPLLFVRTAYVGHKTPSRFPGPAPRSLTWSELRALHVRGAAVESMGHYGVDLARIAPEIGFGDLVRSRRELENRLGSPSRALHYRGDRATLEQQELASQAGFQVGFARRESPPFASPMALGVTSVKRWITAGGSGSPRDPVLLLGRSGGGASQRASEP